MTQFTSLQNAHKILDLIEQGFVGTRSAYAIELGISERMLTRYINELKSQYNIPIKYSKKQSRYLFEDGASYTLFGKRELV